MHKKPPNTQQHKPSCDSMSPENASWQGGPSPPQVVIQRHHQRQRHNGGATVTWRGPGRSHGEAPCRWDGFTALRNAIFWPIYFKPYSRIKGGKSVVACLTPPSSLDCGKPSEDGGVKKDTTALECREWKVIQHYPTNPVQ